MQKICFKTNFRNEKINRFLTSSFVKAVEAIYKCRGKVICAGIGKSGLIARKISATLSSVGISSFFLSPSEANHGDLGQIDKRDMLVSFFLFWKYNRTIKHAKIC